MHKRRTSLDQYSNILRQAVRLHKAGDLAKAESHYRGLIARSPREAPAYINLGILLFERGQREEATTQLLHATARRPNDVELTTNLIKSALGTSSLELIASAYQEAIKCQRKSASIHFYLGIAAVRQGRTIDAIKHLEASLACSQIIPEAHFHLATAYKESGDASKAIYHYNQAIALRPLDMNAYLGLSSVYRDTGDIQEAISCLTRYTEGNPSSPHVWNNLGSLHKLGGSLKLALECYEKALQVNPNLLEAMNNSGVVLKEMGQHELAIEKITRALNVNPKKHEFLFNRGNCFAALGRNEEAEVDYLEAIRINPREPSYHLQYGNLKKSTNPQFAIEKYTHCITLNPSYLLAIRNRAIVYREQKRLQEAIEDFKQAADIDPVYDFILGDFIHSLMMACDWQQFSKYLKDLVTKVSVHATATTPFPLIGLVDDPALQRTSANVFYRTRFEPRNLFKRVEQKPSQQDRPYSCNSDDESRISIAYYSADFHNHATAYLMAEFFEKHDRSVFEVHGFSFGPASNDEMRQRLVNAFDHFHDVRERTDTEIAALSRELGIDIAVDLKGYTQNSRPGIFVDRCAPIQISYLGYPGTQGSDVMDYLIADEVIIPPGFEQYYSEKVIRLPCCYQVNDSKRKVSDRVFTRAECGLPESGFIFCCFNNNYKILPETFDCWMSILKAVPDSVLWLLKDNELAEQNLRQHAQERDVSPDRLVFAGRLPVAEHLARHRLADLFLDTWPCNAHTTASDALWMGLPVLTLQGQSFAARVAASLLHYLGLPELITTNPKDYTQKAIELAKEGVILPLKAWVLQNVKAPQSPFDINHAYQCYEKALGGLSRDFGVS